MSSHRSAALLLASLSLIAGGCLGEVAPKRVVAGTTFTFAFSGSTIPGAPSEQIPVFYGTDPNASENPRTVLTMDRQRGNARFVLCENPEPNCGAQIKLSLRYITRVLPDRGSKFGRGASEGINPPLNGQNLVVLDVPAGIAARTYQLTYVYRPLTAGTPAPETRVTLQPIRVLASTEEAFTDISKALNFAGFSLTTSLQDLVPDPQLQLVLVDMGAADRPAAGRVVLRHPSRVTIASPFEADVLGQASVVRMVPGPVADSVAISFVDLDQKITALRVPFTLNMNAARVTKDDFVIESQDLYRLDGTLLPRVTDPNAVGNSFAIDPSIL